MGPEVLRVPHSASGLLKPSRMLCLVHPTHQFPFYGMRCRYQSHKAATGTVALRRTGSGYLYSGALTLVLLADTAFIQSLPWYRRRILHSSSVWDVRVRTRSPAVPPRFGAPAVFCICDAVWFLLLSSFSADVPISEMRKQTAGRYVVRTKVCSASHAFRC
jgi:hypothetical protein